MKFLFVLICYISVCFAQTGRIIGGKKAFAGEYPFLAAIYKTTSDGSYFCSGSLIDQRWILTAGQCVDGATSFTIYLGTNNIKTPSLTALKLATEEYVLHPDFDPLTLQNDIGLIRLRIAVTFTEYINAITVAFFNLPDNAGKIAAAGWGQTSDDSEGLSDDLYTVQLTSISNQECKITYGDQITDNMVCMVGNYNEGACHGDTGSPILYPYLETPYVPIHVGVSSFVSANGCETAEPSGYTRTYPYVSWIRNVTSY